MNTYPSYKDSGVEWIGEIPSSWSNSKIKYETTVPVQYGINTSSESYVDSGVRFIRTTDISDNGILYSEGVFLDPSDVEEIYRIKIYDFLVSRSGTLGRTYIHMNDDELTYAGYLVRFNFGNESTTRFIFYFSKSKSFDDWLILNTIKSTIGNVNGQKYSNLSIPLPSLQEQQQISCYLDYKTSKIDVLIEKTKQKIELLKEQRTSLINTTVTKGLNPNVEMKDSGVEWIGEIPSGWDVTRLKFIFVLREERTPSGEGELLTVTITNGIVRRRDFVKKGEHLTRSESLAGYKVCYKHDLVNNIMKMGFRCLGISKYNGIVSPAYSVFSLIDNDNCPDYWNYLLRTDLYVTEYKKKSKGIQESRMRLYDDYFLDIFSIVPPLQEQQQIIEYLDKETSKIDTLIKKESKRIELLKEYRQSLISNVVTGKVDVRDERLMQ